MGDRTASPPPPLAFSEKRFPRTRDFVRRFRRRRVGVVSLAILLIVLFCAVFTNIASTHDPIATDFDALFAGPSTDHFLGTDNLGRDSYSRLVEGSRTALLVGFVAIGIGMGFGLPIGVAAGYFGGLRDEILMRIMDALFAFPAILLALVIIAALGTGIQNVMIAIGITFIPGFARIVRGSTLAVKEQEFVMAARAIGGGDLRVASRHILPNTLAPIIVQGSLLFGVAIIIEASLSFLGLGTQPPDPSWGTMLAQSQRFLRTESQMAIYPGLAIVITVLSFNLLGDVLRDLLDPRLRGSD